MATLEDYKSGNAAKAVKMAYMSMKNLDGPLSQSSFAATFREHVEKLVPLALKEAQALELIQGANKCAVGDRICKDVFPQAPSSCSVFLDELADAMVDVGKAEYASVEKAMTAISEHRGNPLVASKISGKYMEICRSWPEHCFYWNLERCGMKCIKKA